ncbi:MAG: hypothetical protein JWR50_1788 [Mucilaginibacter sp.]|nr:hypothetical protein [Mucilaginibacter sp.]
MKNFILTAIITLSLGILSSCAKKDNIRATLTVFSDSPFLTKNVLATAD